MDLPGYGYAKVSKAVKQGWGPIVEQYLKDREQLKLVLLIVDSRLPPRDSDVMMKRWLDHHRIPNKVVLTKTDKLSNNQLHQALRRGAETLNTKEIIAFSAVTGAGKDKILAGISAATHQIPQ